MIRLVVWAWRTYYRLADWWNGQRQADLDKWRAELEHQYIAAKRARRPFRPFQDDLPVDLSRAKGATINELRSITKKGT